MRRGFTLIELVVLLAIFTVIAGMAIPCWTARVTRDKQDETRAEMAALKTAIENYYQDTGVFPSALARLQTNGSPAIPGWNGPYLYPWVCRNPSTQVSTASDSWNTAYVLTTTTSQYTVRSYGPDKKTNTADDFTLTVDVTFLFRQNTVDELKTLNTAITAYNSVWLTTAPLVPPLANILAQLNAKGFLPTPYTTWLTDGWGTAYVESPAGQTPVVKVVSTHVNGT